MNWIKRFVDRVTSQKTNERFIVICTICRHSQVVSLTSVEIEDLKDVNTTYLLQCPKCNMPFPVYYPNSYNRIEKP
jgi:transcription elongation factor Elf1